VVNPDIAFEPSAVRRAVEAAQGADHGIFMDQVATAIADGANYLNAHAWACLRGGSRGASVG
jgi:uncharacterized protein YbjT (DUF2867 family)